MEDEKRLNLKLGIKKQWYCDLCDGVIESSKDGMLEWDSYLPEEKELTAENFRIVHGRWIDGCVKYRPDDHLSDGHLHWYTGPGGLSALLDIQTSNTLDLTKFNIIVRRLHVDLYEEGHRYLHEAREDGSELDPYNTGHLASDDLIWLIEKYGK